MMKNFFFKYGVQIISVILCITILSFQYQRDSALLTDLLSPENTTPNKTDNTQGILPRILEFKPIFGVPPSPEKIQEEQTQRLPETRLELKLKGTFTNSDQENASAIIAAPNGKSRLFFVGDPIVEGTTLARVDTGVVVLSSNGNFEVLRLPIMASKKPESDGFFVSKATSKHHRESTDFGDVVMPDMPDAEEVKDLIIAAATTPAANLLPSNNNDTREFTTTVGRTPTPSLRSRLEKLRARQSLN